jgi:large subunit ribosomal protein L10
VQKRSEKEQVITHLRKKFRAQKVEYKVVKNTLAKRAAKGTGAEALDDLFAGPTAVIMGFEDPISPAKVLQEFLDKKKDLMQVRGAVVDGKRIDAKGVEALSKLPGLNELRAMLLGMIQRPAQQLATILAQPASSLARVLDARREAAAKKG